MMDGETAATRQWGRWSGLAAGMRRQLLPRAGLWLAVGAVLALILVWVGLSPRVTLDSGWTLKMLGLVAAACLATAYRHLRGHIFDERLDTFFRLLMVVIYAALMMQCLRVLNHLGMSLAMPLADHWLMATDEVLGFDWNGYARWAISHPWLRWYLIFAYNMLINIMIAAIVLGALLRGRHERIDEAAFLVLASGLVCIAVSSLFPAEAAWNTVAAPEVKAMLGGEPGANWRTQFMDLRTAEHIRLAPAGMEGLATFPSFHTCLGLTILWCSRGNWLGFAAGSIAGLSVVAATPVFGGHYLVDVLAGAVLMGLLIACWQGTAAMRREAAQVAGRT